MTATGTLAKKLLVIEDDRELIDLLTLHLTAEGYQVDAAADGEAGLRAFESGQYGLVILDWMLPSTSGIDVLREIRSGDVRTPVLMLTARGEEADKVLGLELGCDDYLTKPFSMRELTLRMRAVLRRATPAPTATPVPPTATPEAAAAATTPEPTAEPGDLSFSETSETFPFNQDYFRVAAKVVNAAGTPLDGYYLRILNETTGQQWISDPSEDVWQVTAPNAAFADYREANATFDTRGKAPLAASAYAVWLVDGRGHQLSPVVRLAQNDDEFQWLYVVFTSQ